MQNILQPISNFIEKNKPLLIRNLNTESTLLCLDPQVKQTSEGNAFLQFESLNNHDNITSIAALHEYNDEELYFENEQGAVLMLQQVNLDNYRHYIQPAYVNTQDFDDLEKLHAHIAKELETLKAW